MTKARPTAFLLHGLGGSRRSFAPVIAAWGDAVDAVVVDLPGFGDAAAATGVDLDSAVDAVAAAIRAHGSPRWVLVGHSMGGKIATLVAARALAGTAPVFGLAGVVLLAGSPPMPEPITEERRAQMVTWVADGPLDHSAARTFVEVNVGRALPPDLHAVVIDDLRRCSPAAWEQWLQVGSRADVSAEVGALDVPALVLAGDADPDLGAAAQPGLHGAVYPRAEFVTLSGSGHLLPSERPHEVAEAVVRFWQERAGLGPAVSRESARLIASPRVTARVRAALARRAVADDPLYAPQVLDTAQLATLRALAARVIPQDGDGFDLAARLDARLSTGASDGWRPADLPDDVSAYRWALDALEGFGDLSPRAQHDLLRTVAAGGHASSRLSGSQLALWFQDVCDDLVRIWLAHPTAMAEIDFDGFADGGDATGRIGFTRLGRDERERWEPMSPSDPVRNAAADGVG